MLNKYYNILLEATTNSLDSPPGGWHYWKWVGEEINKNREVLAMGWKTIWINMLIYERNRQKYQKALLIDLSLSWLLWLLLFFFIIVHHG